MSKEVAMWNFIGDAPFISISFGIFHYALDISEKELYIYKKLINLKKLLIQLHSFVEVGGEVKNNMEKVKITINNNGSMKVEGNFEIVDRNGGVYDLGGREVVGICRCGLSKNKPFCDGAHNGNFEHEAVAFALPPKK
jgi:CDGSH-type Zn-finger protein